MSGRASARQDRGRAASVRRATRSTVALALAAVALVACASDGDVERDRFVPRLGGDAAAVAVTEPEELRRLELVATNLVAALVQLPELRPAGTTLQYNTPTNAYGNVVLRALEDAGYGLQRVSADQGRRFVSYSRRLAETQSGPVSDFSLAVGAVSVSREYVRRGNNLYPSSLMTIEGTNSAADVKLADEVFAEQGDVGTAFISGVSDGTGIGDGSAVTTLDVREFDARPPERRSSLETVLAEVRSLELEREAARTAPALDRFKRFRRTVLILDDPGTQRLGAANKQAVRLMTREFLPGDLLEIRACHDADGRDDAAGEQAIRVEEELASHGVPPASSWIAPCVRATYRHASDDSPTPVELIHYRPEA